MGALLVPLSFLTVWEMTFSLPASTFAGLLILLGITKTQLITNCNSCYIVQFVLDHGMLTLNRYILLDPPLMFFISAAVYTIVKFHNQRDRYMLKTRFELQTIITNDNVVSCQQSF